MMVLILPTVNGHEGQFVSISGIGYFNRLDEIVVPHEPEYFYWDPRASVKTYRLANEENSADWSFMFHAACWSILVVMFHAACWSILVDRVAHYGNQDVINKIDYRLFQVLHCTPVDDEGILQPGHDYGGIARFRKPQSYMVREMLDQGYLWCFVEPSRFTSVDDALRHLKLILPPLELAENHSSIATSHESVDGFSKLPAEVVYLLLTGLLSDDVCRLRLASRSVASKSHRDALPQSFWRTRFFPDHEMGFALPIHSEERFHDWRHFYFKIKQRLGLPGAEQLKNRKRIWDLVSREAYTFARHLSNQKV